MSYRKKLIEVALPLGAINAESAREKSIHHGHPSTLHLWWARRPLAASVRQFNVQDDNGLRNVIVSTDPPYYDNIGYADLSDFFYVWLRQTLKAIYPKGWAQEAYAYNSLVIAWPEVQSKAAELQAQMRKGEQKKLDFEN